MIDPNVAASIRTIFIHNGEAVDVADAATLLGWGGATMAEAIKWKVIRLDESSPDAPRIGRRELIEQAFEQWPLADIAAALGPEEADRILGERYAHQGPLLVRDRETAHATALRTLGVSSSPALLLPHAREDALRRMAKTVASPALRVSAKHRRRARRTDGVRVYKLTPHTVRYHDLVPMLRMRGRWLAQLGFKPGMRVYIKTEPGKLVMTVTDPGVHVEVIQLPRLQITGDQS